MSLEFIDYNSIDTKEWSDFVKNHPWGTIFQTPEMYKVYEHTSHNKPFVVAASKEGKLVGVLLAVIITNGNKLLKPITARSIIVGGPLVKDNNPDIAGDFLVIQVLMFILIMIAFMLLLKKMK